MMRSSVKRYGIAPLPETHFPGAHVLVVQICASAPGRGLVLFGKMHESQQAGCHIWPVMLKLRAESLDLVEECAQVRSTLLFAASGPAAPAIGTVSYLRSASCIACLISSKREEWYSSHWPVT